MSWVLSLVGITGLVAVGRHKWWGFAIGLGNEVLWIYFAITRQEYGLILGAVMYGAVNTMNMIRWRRNDGERPAATLSLR
jgi:nicotinamide riboside transporter PnuC